jgi:uroporphyrinogen decarboxylase
MAMTKKERVRRTLHRQEVDRLPTQITYTRAMGEKLAAHLDVSPEELPQRLDNHLLRVDITYPRPVSDDGRVAYDWWGVGWSTETEGYWPVDVPFPNAEPLDTFAWPNPHDMHLLDEAEENITVDGGQHFIVPNLGFCLFERAWSLRGFEPFLMDLILNPGFVEELLERITEIQVVLARRFVALDVDGSYLGDDYGAQKGMLFSPDMWRAWFKPRLARVFSVFREAGRPVMPDLVDIGLTALNPVQPEVLDHAWLRRDFGDRLAFYGGVSNQTALSRGTPLDVQAAVDLCVHTLAGDGTGLLLGPSHRMMEEIPLENVDALLAAFTAIGGGSDDR